MGVNRQVDLARHFLFLLEQMDAEDRHLHLEDTGGLSSLQEYGTLDLKYYLCHAATCGGPVRLAQARFINEIFEDTMSPFEITRIGCLWDGSPASELFACRVPDAFAAQVIRDTFLSAARASLVRYLSETWIIIYQDLGEALAAMSGNPQAVLAYVGERTRSMERYLDRHGRPYMRNPRAKEDRAIATEQELKTMFDNPGIPADQVFFFEAHTLYRPYRLFRLIRELLHLLDVSAHRAGLSNPEFPLGVLPQFIADSGCFLCALASRDGTFSIDQTRMLRLFLGADLVFSQITHIGSGMSCLPDARPRVLAALEWLGKNLPDPALRWFLAEICVDLAAAMNEAGAALLATAPEEAGETRKLFALCMQRLALWVTQMV